MNTTKSIIIIIVALVIVVLLGLAISSHKVASSPAQTITPITTNQPTAMNTQNVDGVMITITKPGTGVAAKSGDTVNMLYTGKLADGTVFDSTDKHGGAPFTFMLGAGQVIKGWDIGVAGMQIGEERTLVIPASLAYGAQGIPGVIPANATLTFDVTLVSIGQ